MPVFRTRSDRAAVALFSAAMLAAAPADACSSVSACLFGDNTGSGPGVAGTSAQGNGIVGTTTYASPDASHEFSGVTGQDFSKSSFSFGVFGYSTAGTGTRGKSTSGVGVLGTSSTGSGVSGSSYRGAGVVGTSTIGSYGVSGSGNTAGVAGTSTAGYGVSGMGYYGVMAQGRTALFAVGGAGGGIVAIGGSNGRFDIGAYETGNAADGVYSQLGPQTGGSAFHAYVTTTAPASTLLFSGTSDVDGRPTDVAAIDASGNMILAGSLATHGAPLARTAASDGRDVVSFGVRASVPSIEDVGVGRLANGRAYVPLDPAFASTTDARASYLVFVTPRGDSKGLFVDRRSPAGFDVRENGDGRSTLAFDYRIVAKPYDTAATRLPSTSLYPRLERGAMPQRPPIPAPASAPSHPRREADGVTPGR